MEVKDKDLRLAVDACGKKADALVLELRKQVGVLFEKKKGKQAMVLHQSMHDFLNVKIPGLKLFERNVEMYR